MVDALVSLTIERLGEYLNRDVKFLQGVKGEVESLKEELKRMHCFINDAQKNQVNNSLIRQWVLDIMDIAYDCEDVLDEFIIDQASTAERRQGRFTFLKKLSSFICSKTQEQIQLDGIGKQIETLKSRLSDVARRRPMLNLQDSNNNTEGESLAGDRLRELRRTNSFQLEENVVGHEDATRTLLRRLLDQDKPQRFVISIYGLGGSGKTTLAGKLYHHPEIKNNFSHRAWVSVSRDYDTKDLLQRIIHSFNKDQDMPELDMRSEEALESYLHHSLKGHSYLVVIDDIWHKKAWDSLKRAFPNEYNCSRVIMTTRMRDIAEGVDDSTFPYELPFLTPDESWQLFCMKAFRNLNMDQELVRLGKKMVENCGGVPLAIVVLGGLLATKKPNEWFEIGNNWNNSLNDDTNTMRILDLSFNYLPSDLKACFIYLGLFPEDYEIKTKKLIRLWVAEGVISQKGDKSMEELAADFLDQLSDRSMIHIGQTRRGRIFTCRLHDLLRDLAIRKARELNFICTNHAAEPLTSRRQAFYIGRQTPLRLQHCNSVCRSLLVFDQYSLSLDLPTLVENLLPNVCTRLRVVRVLLLYNCHFENPSRLPEEIGELVHLKYLGLRNTSVIQIPSSIGKLFSLQTLELPTKHRRRPHLQIPSEIGMLTELRHLIGHFDKELPINNLTKLQTLKNVHGLVWSKINTEKLVNLRKLRITGYHNTEKDVFTFHSIANLKSLRILSITLSDDSNYFGSLEPLDRCEYLQELKLEGKILNLPGNLPELVPNLECLSLDESNLKEDPMPKLEKLLNLTHLQLGFNSYRGSKMTCSANGFPRLEILNLCPGSLFDEWEVKEGALPVLKDLKIVVHPERMTPRMVISTKRLKLSARVHVNRATICCL